jgi:HSP20 family protein
MTLIRWSPLREVDSFQREMNRLFSDFWGGRSEEGEPISGAWTPAVDIYEDQDHYTVSVALPGLTQKDIKVNIENNVLSISGERQLEKEDKRENYARIEQLYGSFNRTFTLPNTIDTHRVEAKMDKGVLTVTLPRREEAKPRAIEVKVS